MEERVAAVQLLGHRYHGYAHEAAAGRGAPLRPGRWTRRIGPVRSSGVFEYSRECHAAALNPRPPTFCCVVSCACRAPPPPHPIRPSTPGSRSSRRLSRSEPPHPQRPRPPEISDPTDQICFLGNSCDIPLPSSSNGVTATRRTRSSRCWLLNTCTRRMLSPMPGVLPTSIQAILAYSCPKLNPLAHQRPRSRTRSRLESNVSPSHVSVTLDHRMVTSMSRRFATTATLVSTNSMRSSRTSPTSFFREALVMAVISPISSPKKLSGQFSISPILVEGQDRRAVQPRPLLETKYSSSHPRRMRLSSATRRCRRRIRCSL